VVVVRSSSNSSSSSSNRGHCGRGSNVVVVVNIYSALVLLNFYI
jgi:hypothetical protein